MPIEHDLQPIIDAMCSKASLRNSAMASLSDLMLSLLLNPAVGRPLDAFGVPLQGLLHVLREQPATERSTLR